MVKEHSEPQEYWLMAIEINDVVDRWDPPKPNLYIAKTVTPPEERFATIQRSKKKHWYTDLVIRLRTDLVDTRTYTSSIDEKTIKLALTPTGEIPFGLLPLLNDIVVNAFQSDFLIKQ
jgi:hypothetical protein